ncbi:anticodon binding domain of tRNAs-domain-containing protein [Lineolata rhizophorae]|uniref:non-specific serine/threonine protein kinase n=1 Tax=Lineolata rhizophorae TaxID=578093 RepID=A0A6A6P0I1_9PEZI|nr:anticodon binding domain of tRNAs-domain-containing protein [Lineolata rhizophorae]
MQGVRERSRHEIETIISMKPKELLGEVMIYEIASSIQEVLEDAVASREQDNALPSLAEAREKEVEKAHELARRQEEDLQKKMEEEKAEEDRALKRMVDDEMRRRQKHKSRQSTSVIGNSLSDPAKLNMDAILFDRLITCQEDNNTFQFSAVAITRKVGAGPLTEVFMSQPMTSGDQTPPCLALKKTKVKVTSSTQTKAKKRILELEEEIEDLKRLRSDSIAAVLDFKIEKLESESNESKLETWEISILTDFGNKGSLCEMLELIDTIPTDRVRSWSIDLLEALDFYHRNGVIHKRLHPNNVLLSRSSSSGAISVQLADAGFQESLYELRDIVRSTKPAVLTSAYWIPTELSQAATISRRSRKTDIWDLGVIFLQMIFGLRTPEQYSSPSALIEALELSQPLEDIIRKFFRPDTKKRPSAFDLMPSEFLRSEAPVFDQQASRPPLPSRLSSSSASLPIPLDRRVRRESSGAGAGMYSRYASEWVETGRLGKGGYGEVVKARNKLDGRIYAIKKIRLNSSSALSEVLSEVMLLSRLNHPYVVRYYAAWPEDDTTSISETEEDTPSFSEDTSSVSKKPGLNVDFGQSTGGLDFISSSGFPKIEFEDDSDENAVESDSEADDDIVFQQDNGGQPESTDSSPALQKKRSQTSSRAANPPMKVTLYIQMEYCERQTLRDLIRKGLYSNPDDAWRLFRQILEGLVHMHSHGIIHRDLKPDNIFIDMANNPRIGDFGLATSGQYHLADKAVSGAHPDGDMTRSIGTTLYVAPELRSDVGGSYNDKVDMYSLGIIFFEMCYPLKTAMERDHVIRNLREKIHTLPQEFNSPDKALQGSIITSLISHRPSERPSSAELLRSGKLPLQIEDETIRQALQGLSDSSSPYYQKIMSALFSQSSNREVKDLSWDLGAANGAHSAQLSDLVLQGLVKDRLSSIFRRHGAVEIQRDVIFPSSSFYSNNSVMQLLDASGTLVQLPYDLTLPFARAIAREAPAAEKTFTIGTVFRDTYTGGAPRSNGEADFDIISYGTLDLALKEAEVIKVVDEIIDGFPSLSSSQMCFHLNHSDLLDIIMDFCRISKPQRPTVKETLSKLNIQQWTWQKIRNELRSPTLGISSTSLDDMARFDFRDTPEKAFGRISSLLEGTEYLDKTHATFAHLRSVMAYTKQFNVRRKLYVSPLSSFNEKFYSGGILFQCLFDTKRRDVLAAGGRYDRLIADHQPKVQGHFTGCHAVGVNLGWDRLVTSMARYSKPSGKSSFLKKATEEELQGHWAGRRCDVLVASFDKTVLRSSGVKILAELWAHDLSAELAVDARSPEQLLANYRDDKHCWIIIIKHEASGTGKPDLKIKNMLRKEDTDLRSSDLISYLRAEIRERDHREGVQARSLQRLMFGVGHGGVAEGGSSGGGEHKNSVQVLVAQHRSKKSNKWSVVESAQARARALLESYAACPIAAVETRDDLMDGIKATRLSDPDSWRKVVQSAPLADRAYLQQLHDLLLRYAAKWKEEENMSAVEEGGGMAFVYNFRSGSCFLYDLSL